MNRFVIIGGGIAGTTAAETLRKLDAAADITIIDAESHPLYSRVLLRNVVKGQIDREKVFMKKAQWYADKEIELLSDTRVVKIDTKNQFVETSNARELPYDKLLIASGGDVRLMPQDKRGVSYFRTLDDIDHMMQLLNEVRALPEGEQHGITLGASFIALDYINIYFKYDIPQTVITRGHGFWTKILSKETSDMLVGMCKDKGVTFFTDQSEVRLLGETELAGVELSDGTQISGSMLGVGIGIAPDWPLFKAAGIKADKGVLCNEYLETNVENVYTAGDVAQFQDVAVDRQRVVGNWLNATMQARIAAANMTGERKVFELVSGYTTELLGLEMAFVGDTDRAAADDVRQLKLEGQEAVEVFDRKGKTVGAVLIGDVSQRQAITDAIKNKELYQA